jgi:phage gp29-like protein
MATAADAASDSKEMGFFGRLKAAFSPAKVTGNIVIAGEKPLIEQVARIGGGVTPETVSNFLRQADAGQPERLVDLFNESREKDCHLQGACYTRDIAVGLCDIDFTLPKDATAEEKKGLDLCRRAVEEFKNWSTLVEHLTSSYLPGHATSTLDWHRTKDGFLLPFEAKNVHPREFIFTQDTGALRYRRFRGDIVGVDLLAENPGRVVQLQRRIVGDAQVREGLERVLVWAALFRNWDLRDWLALGELGWKPYLLAKYAPGTHQKEIDKLVRVLEAILRNGYSAIPKDADVSVEWPKGTGPSGQSSHRELFDVIGREISKAVLGTTTSMESGPNGDRAGVAKRDELRTDIREADARAVAGALRYHFFAPIIALNAGPDARVPVPKFQTEESANQLEFAQAVGELVDRGLGVPAKWVRDEVGMPEPVDGEELMKPPAAPQPGDGGDEGLDIPVTVEGEDDEGEDPPPKKPRKKSADAEELPSTGARSGLKYADDLTESGAAAGAKTLASTVAAMVTEIVSADSYEDARNRIEAKYSDVLEPVELKHVLEAGMNLAQLAGRAAVIEDTPELHDET